MISVCDVKAPVGQAPVFVEADCVIIVECMPKKASR